MRKHLILFHNHLYKRHSELANATAGDLWKETKHVNENMENLSAEKEQEDVFRAAEMSRTEDWTHSAASHSVGCRRSRCFHVYFVWFSRFCQMFQRRLEADSRFVWSPESPESQPALRTGTGTSSAPCCSCPPHPPRPTLTSRPSHFLISERSHRQRASKTSHQQQRSAAPIYTRNSSSSPQ